MSSAVEMGSSKKLNVINAQFYSEFVTLLFIIFMYLTSCFALFNPRWQGPIPTPIHILLDKLIACKNDDNREFCNSQLSA
jgi:hypothetical protein